MKNTDMEELYDKLSKTDLQKNGSLSPVTWKNMGKVGFSYALNAHEVLNIVCRDNIVIPINLTQFDGDTFETKYKPTKFFLLVYLLSEIRYHSKD